MSYFPCKKCGKMVGVIGQTVNMCGCQPDETLTFQWLTDNGYPTSGMSQKEGFTTFQLAPILEAYWKFRNQKGS